MTTYEQVNMMIRTLVVEHCDGKSTESYRDAIRILEDVRHEIKMNQQSDK